jgi:hypothetical protein
MVYTRLVVSPLAYVIRSVPAALTGKFDLSWSLSAAFFEFYGGKLEFDESRLVALELLIYLPALHLPQHISILKSR